MRDKAAKQAYQKKYYAKNKQRLRARNKEYYYAHPERALVANKRRYAQRRADPWVRAQYLVRAARERAKRKGLACSLSAADIAWQIEVGICPVTGIPFNLSASSGRHPFTPSIDRIDNTQGYVTGNVRVVVWAYNAMRGDWGDEVLLQIAHALRPSATPQSI